MGGWMMAANGDTHYDINDSNNVLSSFCTVSSSSKPFPFWGHRSRDAHGNMEL